ncbi:hypothetical protein TNCV_3672511 [Trichonephila clavipes]|nr:hypothetical protein TNCV_3672511 [Trichonephila clavipes]
MQDQCPHGLLAARKRGSYQLIKEDMPPRYGSTKWALGLCHQRLVQQSSGDKLLGRDLYQELRLKAKKTPFGQGVGPLEVNSSYSK